MKITILITKLEMEIGKLERVKGNLMGIGIGIMNRNWKKWELTAWKREEMQM